MAASSSSGAAQARKELRDLKDQVLNNVAEATSTRSDFLSKALNKANVLYEVTKTDARGAALDASLLSTTSQLGAEQAGNLEKITPEKYISKLKTHYGYRNATNLKWNELAAKVGEASIFQPAPAVTFIDGRFDAPVKKARQVREKRSRDEPEGPAQVAQSVDVEKLKETAVEKAQVVRMKTLHKTIKKASAAAEGAGQPKRVSLFQTLLHPTSFSQTVENFFDLSFLVKQGQVSITTDDEGAYLTDSKPPVADDFNTKGITPKQNVLKLDYATWRKLVARHITAATPALLPGRPAAAAAAAAEEDDGDEDVLVNGD